MPGLHAQHLGLKHRGRPTARLALVLAALAALVVAMAAGAQELQIIELQHRQADEVIAIVQPLLEPGGMMTGADDQLFVRTSPANLAQIEAAVAAVDRALRQLRITVGQGTARDVQVAGVRGSATLGDDDIRVGVNRPPGAATGVEVEAAARSSDADLRNVSTVTTLEGSETFISVGESVPVRATEVAPGWGGPVIRQSTTYVDVASGFYATARLNGDQVLLEISPRQQSFRSERGGVIASQGLTSMVSGRLGEWIELGAVKENSADSAAGILVWGRRTVSSEYAAWVRVEALP